MTETKLELTKAAEYLKISRRTLWLRAKAGEIKFTKDLLDKRKKLFLLADLDKLKEASNGRNN
ncbi:MAG: helix-turn-helix domain-containing protein [Blastocatellia bacterium]